MKKLPKKIKKQWVEALRSGEYQQGTGRLCRAPQGPNAPGEFCCLGVYLHEFDPRPWEEPVRGILSVDGFIHGLPHDVVHREVFDQQYTQGATVENVLAALNDDKGYTFEQIANWIEKNL